MRPARVKWLNHNNYPTKLSSISHYVHEFPSLPRQSLFTSTQTALVFCFQMQINFILAGNGSHKPVVAIKKSMAYKHAVEKGCLLSCIFKL